MAEPSPGAVAFLAAMIVGSSNGAAADPHEREVQLRLAALRVHQEIDTSGGRVLTAGGGQAVVVYEQPATAIVAAIALAAAFASADATGKGPAVGIQIALHAGRATDIDDGAGGALFTYLGHLLSASRRPGLILASRPIMRLLRSRLPSGAQVRGTSLMNPFDGSDPSIVYWLEDATSAAMAPAVADSQPAPSPPQPSPPRKRSARQTPPRKRAGTDPEQFRVYTLGRFRVQRGGVDVQLANSQGLKGLQLFKCLLSRPSRCIPRNQAYELFWPDSLKTKVNTTFRTNVKRLRDLLEPDVDAQASILQYTPEIVTLRTEPPVWVDADEFERLIQEARHAAPSEALLEEADRLWEGEYLPDDLHHAWAAPRRAELGRLWTELQFELARRREHRGDEHGAAAALQKLLAADQTDEQAARELMRLDARRGRCAEALKVYQRLEEALSRELQTVPSAETQSVRQRVAAGEIDPMPPADASPCTRDPQAVLTSQPVGQSASQSNDTAAGPCRC